MVACPKYQHIRLALDDHTKSSLISWEIERVRDLFSTDHVLTTARYVNKLFKIRFPRNEEDVGSKKKKDRAENNSKKKISKNNSDQNEA